MRVLAHVPFAWPTQRGGSEVAMHRLLAWLAAQGHEVRCIVTRHRGVPTDGVTYQRRDAAGIREWWAWADVALSQHTGSEAASDLGQETGTPVAHLAHNWHVLDAYRDGLHPDDLMVWNTQAMADALGPRWAGPSTVCRPVVHPDRFARSAGTHITQVNLSPLKGGDLFWKVSRSMLGTRFLGVVGGWGPQVDARGHSHRPQAARGPLAAAASPNVEVIGTTTDIATDVLARTRVLMMPTGQVSDSQPGESYGLIAAEACCAGIPVIATRTVGTEEALGAAGIWCDPASPDQWRTELHRLNDPDEWQAASDACIAQAALLDPTAELVALEATLTGHAALVSA